VKPRAAELVRLLKEGEVGDARLAQMDRRTGCLQANIEFLHQTMTKLQRETREKLASAARDAAADRAEIAALKSTVAKLTSELAQLKAKEAAASKK